MKARTCGSVTQLTTSLPQLRAMHAMLPSVVRLFTVKVRTGATALSSSSSVANTKSEGVRLLNSLRALSSSSASRLARAHGTVAASALSSTEAGWKWRRVEAASASQHKKVTAQGMPLVCFSKKSVCAWSCTPTISTMSASCATRQNAARAASPSAPASTSLSQTTTDAANEGSVHSTRRMRCGNTSVQGAAVPPYAAGTAAPRPGQQLQRAGAARRCQPAPRHAPYGLAAPCDTTASTRARGGGAGSADDAAVEGGVAPGEAGKAEARGAAGVTRNLPKPALLRDGRLQRDSAALRGRCRNSEAARGEAAAVAFRARMPPALCRTRPAGGC